MENRAKAYWRHRHISFFLGLILIVSYLAIIQFSGLSFIIKSFSQSFCSNFYVSLAIYLFILNLGCYIFTFPVTFYEGFVLEHNFSMSNQALAAWMTDELKKAVISLLVFLLLVVTFYTVAISLIPWWFAVSVLWVAFSALFANLFPVLVVPLFYKYNPLPDNELRSKTIELAARFNIRLMDVYEIDFSKTTKKSNAALVGWGGTKRVILTDNLINEFTPDEVTVVVAHEMAHYVLRHIFKLILFGAVSTTAFFFLLSRLLPRLASLLAANGPFDMAIFPAIWTIFIIYNIILMPAQNGFSRKLEEDADLLAIKMTGLKDAFVSLMNKLAEKNLSDKDPNKVIEFIFYDHPPISRRIENVSKNSPKTFS